MKTSSKLLIAFFILMPLLMIAFDLLLKDQYVKGNITGIRAGAEKSADKYKLKPFKYVVYNGKVVYRRGGREKTMGSSQRLRIVVGKGNTYRIGLDLRKKEMVEYTHYADTLFISYRLKDMAEEYYYWSGLVTLYAPELDGVSAGDGTVIISPCRQETPLKVQVLPFTTVSGRGIDVPQLHLSVAGGSKMELEMTDVDTLVYDLKAKSELAIKQSYTIKVLKPGMVDSESIISISGSAAKMAEVVSSGLQAPGIDKK